MTDKITEEHLKKQAKQELDTLLHKHEEPEDYDFKKYPWWDWTYFLKMQVDWLRNAASKYEKEGKLSNSALVAKQLTVAAGGIESIMKEMSETLDETELKKLDDDLRAVYSYIATYLRNWWD